MGGVRANWFVDLERAEEDALEVAVEEAGLPIDLDGEEPTLNQRLVELGTQEQFLYGQGVECKVKDRPDTACSVCPLRDAEGPMAALCKLGVEQEQVSTRLAVLRVARKS